jgi:hypothetical protein
LEDAAKGRVSGKNSFEKIFFGGEEYNRLTRRKFVTLVPMELLLPKTIGNFTLVLHTKKYLNGLQNGASIVNSPHVACFLPTASQLRVEPILRRSYAQLRNFIVTAHNCGALIAVKKFICSTKIDCDAVTRNCEKIIAVARSYGKKFAVMRSCVAIFRNYGSQCDCSYAQLRRNSIAVEHMGCHGCY